MNASMHHVKISNFKLKITDLNRSICSSYKNLIKNLIHSKEAICIMHSTHNPTLSLYIWRFITVICKVKKYYCFGVRFHIPKSQIINLCCSIIFFILKSYGIFNFIIFKAFYLFFKLLLKSNLFNT
jgi:hypothetical protein